MTNAKNIITKLEKLFPDKFRMEWDTTDGLIAGDVYKIINKAIVSLEFRANIASINDADMIILHHPPIFGPKKNITNPFYKQYKSNGKVIYSIHSRIDKAGFVSQAIAERLFEKKDYIISKILEDGSVIIELKKHANIDKIIDEVKKRLNLKSLNVIINKENIKIIGIHGGEAFQQHHISDAIEEHIDLYLGGDMSHHLAESAYFFNASFIDIGHFSEQEGMKKLAKLLKTKFPKINFEYIEQTALWSIR